MILLWLAAFGGYSSTTTPRKTIFLARVRSVGEIVAVRAVSSSVRARNASAQTTDVQCSSAQTIVSPVQSTSTLKEFNNDG